MATKKQGIGSLALMLALTACAPAPEPPQETSSSSEPRASAPASGALELAPRPADQTVSEAPAAPPLKEERTPAGQYVYPQLPEVLMRDGTAEQRAAVAQILATPERHTPETLVWVARALFIAGRQDEALTWFAAAVLRGQAGVDLELRALGQALAGQGPKSLVAPLLRYGFAHPKAFEAAIGRAQVWAAQAPHHYPSAAREAFAYPHEGSKEDLQRYQALAHARADTLLAALRLSPAPRPVPKPEWDTFEVFVAPSQERPTDATPATARAR